MSGNRGTCRIESYRAGARGDRDVGGKRKADWSRHSCPSNGCVHVGLNLCLTQRNVVDANLIDQAHEIFAIRRIATDTHRVGVDLDRARYRPVRHFHTVHVQADP